MARFNTVQKCILGGLISLLGAYGSGNFVVFTGFCCSVILGWFFSISLLRFNSHFASECMLDIVTLLKSKYHAVLAKVHGEEFVRKLQVAKEPPQPKNASLTQEIKLFIDFISQDFVSSWYDYISDEQQTFEEIQEILEDLSVIFLRKVKSLHVHRTAENVIWLFQKHLTEFQEVKKQWQLQPNYRKKGNKDGPEFKKKKNVIQMYKKLDKFHVCLNGDVTESRYLLAMVDTLLKILLDEKVHQSYVVKELVTEILAVNVVHNVVHLLSDPHFLHKAIILLTSDDELIIVDHQAADGIKTSFRDEGYTVTCNDEVLNASSNVATNSGPVREEPDGVCSTENDDKTNATDTSNRLNNSCDTDKTTHNNPNHKQSEEQSFLWNYFENPETQSLPTTQVINATSTPSSARDSDVNVLDDCLLGVSPVEADLSKTNSAPDLIAHCEQSISSKAPAADLHTPELGRRPSLPLVLDETTMSSVSVEDASIDSAEGPNASPKFFLGPEASLEDEESSSIDSDIDRLQRTSAELHSLQLPRPRLDEERKSEVSIGEAKEVMEDLEAETHVPPQLLFAEVSIPETESAREAYNNQTYTLYVIQYMAWHKCEDNESWALKPDLVKRRYREFITLQDRIESHPHYRRTVRKIKGPSRWNTLHIGQMQDHRIESRRKFLQSYLKKLIEAEDVGNSMAVKEFLAYEGDARIAFVKKAREIPRFDKVIVKTVSGVFRSISSALPIVPDEDRPSSTSSNLSATERLSSPESEWVDPDRFSFSFNLANDETLKKSEMEDVMNICVHETEREEQESCSSSSVDKDDDFRDALEVSFLCLPRSEGDGSEETAPPVVEAADSSIPLCAAVLDVAALSADGVDSWVRKEKIFYLIKVLLGRALERFLREEISDLTTERRWTFYLETLRETLWPGGQWDSQPVQPPSEQQKIVTKHQAHQCLVQFFPSFIPAVVGFEDYDDCIGEIMECLQYPELNRHFIYCLLDHMLDMTFPEFENGQLHEELLTTIHIGEDMVT